MLNDLYPWIVYLHVSAAFGFVLAHGVAVFAAFRIRTERDRARIAAMLDLSTASHGLMYGALVTLVVAGVAAGIIGGWFGRLWIWTSIGILVVVTVAMILIATRHYVYLRQIVGASVSERDVRPVAAANPECIDQELAARLRTRHPELLAAIGGGGLLIVIWLMLAKPF